MSEGPQSLNIGFKTIKDCDNQIRATVQLCSLEEGRELGEWKKANVMTISRGENKE